MATFQEMIDAQKASIRKYRSYTPAVEVVAITPQEEYKVNGKTVRKDMDGTWVSDFQLTNTERKFFAEYLEMITSTKVKGTIHATYK